MGASFLKKAWQKPSWRALARAIRQHTD
jgi:hypothetical protein